MDYSICVPPQCTALPKKNPTKKQNKQTKSPYTPDALENNLCVVFYDLLT